MLDLMHYNVLKVQKIVNLGKSFILGKAKYRPDQISTEILVEKMFP